MYTWGNRHKQGPVSQTLPKMGYPSLAAKPFSMALAIHKRGFPIGRESTALRAWGKGTWELEGQR